MWVQQSKNNSSRACNTSRYFAAFDYLLNCSLRASDCKQYKFPRTLDCSWLLNKMSSSLHMQFPTPERKILRNPQPLIESQQQAQMRLSSFLLNGEVSKLEPIADRNMPCLIWSILWMSVSILLFDFDTWMGTSQLSRMRQITMGLLRGRCGVE